MGPSGGSGAGNLYIGDTSNNRIRKVDVSDPPSLTFPSTHVGSASAAQDVGIENVGNDVLNIASIAPSANFTLQGADTSCNSSSQTLAPSLSCILGIEFAPSSASAISGTIGLTDNALNVSSATQTIQLNGTGALQPQTITFPNPGPQTYGVAPLTLNATASSGLPVSYAVTSGPATVSSSTLTITGAGSVTVQAMQGGNSSWLPAQASITITVNQATLTFVADNQVMGQGSVGIPPLTYSYYGFVNADTPTSVGLSGLPSLSTWTTAQPPAQTTITSATASRHVYDRGGSGHSGSNVTELHLYLRERHDDGKSERLEFRGQLLCYRRLCRGRREPECSAARRITACNGIHHHFGRPRRR